MTTSTATGARPVVTYYHVPHAPTSYHTDRQCYWLREARERGTVVEVPAKKLRTGELLPAAGRSLKRCPRCGR